MLIIPQNADTASVSDGKSGIETGAIAVPSEVKTGREIASGKGHSKTVNAGYAGYGDYYTSEEEYYEWYGSIKRTDDWIFLTPYQKITTVLDGLYDIPDDWSLVPICDKAPKRTNWQVEPPLSRTEIRNLLKNGDTLTSKYGKPYHGFYSGVGLRTGDVSNGLLTIDIDGHSAQPLLDLMSHGELPVTPSWKSGKPGRLQIVFQIPDSLRELLADFTKVAVKNWGPLQCSDNEQVEFRYNRMQSCLPPSRHPDTGEYSWIYSPADVETAIAPAWLCDLLVPFVSEKRHLKHKEQGEIDSGKLKRDRQDNRDEKETKDLIDFLNFDVLPKLDVLEIFNGDHAFQQVGSTLKGDPTWRKSSSGTSLHVWWDGKQWAWQDKLEGYGGGAVQYRWKMRGGSGTPRGKDFVAIVAELAHDAKVKMPPFIPIPNTGDSDIPTSQTYEEWREGFNKQCVVAAQHDLTIEPSLVLTGEQKLTDISFDLLPKSGILAMKAGWGLGKTTASSLWLTQSTIPDRLAVVHRISLVSDISPKLDLISYEDLKSLGMLNSWGKLAIVDVSMAVMLDVGIWKNQKYILVLDEIEQVLNNLVVGGNIKGKLRLAAKQKYEFLIRNAELIIVMDADLSDITLNWLKYLRNEDVFLIEHQAKVGESRSKIFVSTNKGKTIERILAAAGDGEKLQIFCEHRSDVQQLAAKLKELGLKVGCFHGRNANEPDVSQNLAKISQYEVYSQYDVLIYTSILGTGVSQETFYYTKRFVLFHGDVLSATEGLQGVWRYRPDVPTEVFLSNKSRTFNIDPSRELLNLFSRETATNTLFAQQETAGVKATLIGVEEYSLDDNEYLKMWAAMICRRNASLANPMGAFLNMLDQNKFSYEIEEEDKNEAKDFLDCHREGIRDRNDERDLAVAQSELISEEANKKLLKQGGKLTESQQIKVDKYRIHSWTGLDVDQELVRNERQNGIIRKVQLLNCVLGTEKAAIALDDKDRQSNPIITDRKHWTLKRNLIHKIGLMPLLEPGWKYNSDSPQIVEIAETARRNVSEIKKILNLTINGQKIKDKKTGEVKFKMSNMAVVGMLLKLLGVTTDSEGTKRSYFIDRDNWDLVQKILEHQRNKKLTESDESTSHTPQYKYSIYLGGVRGSNAVPDLRTDDEARKIKRDKHKEILEASSSSSLDELGNFDDEEYPFSMFDSLTRSLRVKEVPEAIAPEPLFDVGAVVECEVDGCREVGTVEDKHFYSDTSEWVYQVQFGEGEALIYESGMRLWADDTTEAIT